MDNEVRLWMREVLSEQKKTNVLLKKLVQLLSPPSTVQMSHSEFIAQLKRDS